MDTKNEFSFYLEKIVILTLSALFFLFPLAISPLTTESFAIPKQALLAVGAIFSVGLLSVKMLADARVRIRRSPFDLGIILFAFSLLLSAIFAVNKADAFMAFGLGLFAVIIYFTTLNISKTKNYTIFLAASLLVGAAASSLFSILAFFRINILPYPFIQTQTFTPIGTLLDQAIYLAALIPIGFLMLFTNQENLGKSIKQNLASVSIPISLISLTLIVLTGLTIIGLTITIYQLMYKQTPNILPFETGFQTAFATISQDTGRMLKSFLFGSGVGTYSVDFLRFRQIEFNQNEPLWSLTFFRSSSFVLELLATTGVLGFLSFIFFSIKVIREAINSIKNPLAISVLLIVSAGFLLPLSFVTQTLLFIIIALFASYEAVFGKKESKFFDVDIQIVALRQGLIAIEATSGKTSSLKNRLLPILSNIIVFIIVLWIGTYSFQYFFSDLAFQRSLVAASQNNGSLTYQEQTKALKYFPYRDSYFRVYSQTNLALANSLASQIKPEETPSAQTQQNIINLIQQSISSARTATTIAPHTAINWQNLSSIYRSLIGYGQNADQFAIATQQQAIILNPNNPLQYLALGGIYYQLQRWDEAQNQFQIAIRLKPDFANAYYNLGHALEQKEDIKNSLAQYEIVKKLVANDPSALKQITDEINALKAKEEQQASVEEAPTQKEKPLEIDQPSSTLPPQESQVEIQAPPQGTGEPQKAQPDL